MMQSAWASFLDPLINNPMSKGVAVQATLVSGANTINHLLSRKQQGWMITDLDAAVTVYRSQPFNDKTLTLTSSGAANIQLYVY